MGKLLLQSVVVIGFALSSAAPAVAQQPGRSTPQDTNIYSRPAIPADTAAGPQAVPSGEPTPAVSVNVMRVIDVIVNNTDPNLKTTDMIGGREAGIAVNPNNRNQITISAFSARWGNGANASLWNSTDGGQTWTENLSIPPPPGISVDPTGSPADQAFDYGTNNILFGTILVGGGPSFVYSGSTTNPASSASWAWWLIGGVAQPTESSASPDQPWLVRNRGTDPANAAFNNVYVAYDDFGADPPATRVAASINLAPPQFTKDVVTGNRGPGGFRNFINPGHRLAADPRNGWMYSLYQHCIASCDFFPQIDFQLNRSIDEGSSWSLNGSSTGILVAKTRSYQPYPKFGTVNTLLGGIDHAAVDPSTGDVYVVYGYGDTAVPGANNLAIRRVVDNGAGGVTVGAQNIITAAPANCAIPSVAVTNHGTIGVFYYCYNGIVSGFPQFTASLAVSTNQGTSFSFTPLKTFLSPATEDPDNPSQRILGDFEQLKAIDNCFYGGFVANRAAFSGSLAVPDPVFVKACYGQSASTHDISGDGKSDILWRNTNGDVAIWFMDSATILSSVGLGNVSTTWTIVGQRDFNGDGFADILWRDNSGNVAIWLLNGLGEILQAGGLGNVGTAWSVAGTGDFNGDGKGDILWRDSSGNTAIWLMNGLQIQQAGGLGNIPTTWSVAGTADFNSDGQADILWRDSSGNTAIWLMNGLQVLQTGGLGNIPTTWSVAGTGAFNGDGKWDILWKDTNGNVAIWLMNGLQVLQTGGLGNVGTNWNVAQTGDYNSDGKSDILWRDTSGNTAIWFMNGLQIGSTAGLGNIPTTWTIQGVNSD
jgi:hypothetical protein